MTVACPAPDGDIGVALRLADYLDCTSRALGENGFQAFAGGPIVAALLSAAVTIFVALIGYRMILGSIPEVRDGVGWAARLGIVLALVTSWPAFQTLVYRVAADGPGELAGVMLPAAGLDPGPIDERVQRAYDIVRLGTSAIVPPPTTSDTITAGTPSQAPAPLQVAAGMPPSPQTASWLVVSTSGLTAALRLAVGFLVAVAPLAILCLLFDATLGVFDGWVRALAGAALGVLASSVTAAIELAAVETEILHDQAVQIGADAATSLDAQALATIVLLFTVVALASVLAALRMASAFHLSFARSGWSSDGVIRPMATSSIQAVRNVQPSSAAGAVGSHTRTRSGAVADALASAVHREQGGSSSYSNSQMTLRPTGRAEAAVPHVPLGVAGRRSTGRRTRSAARRDRTA